MHILCVKLFAAYACSRDQLGGASDSLALKSSDDGFNPEIQRVVYKCACMSTLLLLLLLLTFYRTIASQRNDTNNRETTEGNKIVLKECQELVLRPKQRHKIKREREKRKEEDCMSIYYKDKQCGKCVH